MFKKLSEKIALEIKAQFKDVKVQEFITQIKEVKKEVQDERRFKVIASTGVVDRWNEIVDPNGLQKDNYLKNPVVLWGHDYRSLPIGVVDKLYVKDKKVIAEGWFAPADANPEAEKVFKLYNLKILRAVSIGFIPKAWEDFKDDEGYKRKYTKWELLELSFVPVPANPEAVDIMKNIGDKLGVNLDKMFITEEKREKSAAMDAIKELAFVVKELSKEIQNIKNNHGQESKPTTDNHGSKDKTDGGDERIIVLSGEFAQKLRQNIQSADKVLEQVNIALKTAINKITE